MIVLFLEVFLPIQYKPMEVTMKILLATTMALAVVFTLANPQSAEAMCGVAGVASYGHSNWGGYHGWRGHGSWGHPGYMGYQGYRGLAGCGVYSGCCGCCGVTDFWGNPVRY
jgi:hypothetical protein